jgi:hypothetical protein
MTGGMTLVQAQTLSTTYALTASQTAVTFAVQNTNPTPVQLTSVSCGFQATSNGGTFTLWASTTSLSGAPTIATPTWSVVGSGTISSNALAVFPVLSGLSYVIPANSTVRFAAQSSTSLVYGGAASTPNNFSSGGVSLLVGSSQVSALPVGYGGAFPAPAFQPRFFAGSLTFTPVTLCTGTPNPGNTTANVLGACPGTNFTVGLQNPTPGVGVTYAWEFDNGGGWTAFGTSAPSQLVNQSVPTSYRCTVDCAAGGGSPTATTSTPISVPMATTFPVDFTPTVFPSNCWTATASAQLVRSTANGYAAAGTGSALWNFFNSPAATVLSVTSPVFTPVGAGQQLRFDVAGAAYTGDGGVTVDSDILNVEVSTTGGASWTTLDAMSNNTGGAASTAPPQAASFVPTAAQWNTRTYAIPTGTNMIRFRGVSGFGNNVYVDNILVEPIPTCFVPTGISVSGTSTTTAQVSFTPNASTSYIIEYGAPGFTPGTAGTAGGGTVISTTTSPVTIPGLVHPTQYQVYVRSFCGGVDYSANSNGFLFFSQPPFDVCSAITTFPSVAPGAAILLTGNSSGATDTEGFGALVSWEAFTLTGCTDLLTIDYCASTPPRTNAFTNLFVGCPQSAGFIPPTTAALSCANGGAVMTYASVPPGTYYIGVMNQAGATGPYGINVIAGAACPPPPANDECTAATPIACGDVLSGTTVNATSTGAPASLCNGFLNNTSGGVWYVAENLCGSVSASICGTTPTWDSKIAVYSGSCGALVCVTTDDDFCAPLSQATWTADASETYYIYVLGFGSADEGAFSLTLNCANTPVAATATVVDDCGTNSFDVDVDVTNLGGAASVTIDHSINGAAQAPITGVLVGITNLGPFAAGDEVSVSVSNGATGCAANLGNRYSNCPVDVVCGSTVTYDHCYRNNDTRTWTFNPPNAGESVTLTFIGGTINTLDVVRIYSGTSNAGTLLASSSVSNLNGLTGTSAPGESIFMEIEATSGSTCADGDQTTWQFEVECTAGCTDADGIVTENVDCSTYSFTLDVEVTSTGDGATTDLVYTVNGGAPTTITGLVAFDTENIGPFTIGDVVNVVLAHETDGACDRNLGNFQPGLSCPPPGTSCALPLVVSSFPYTQSNTTCGKGNDIVGTQCGLGANYGGGEDFVYQLNIPSTGDYQINLQLSGGASFAGWFLKSSSNCTNASACVANGITTAVNGLATGIVNLTAGTYYLIIDSRPLPNCVAYTLNIAPFVFLPGDNCNNAITLTTAASCVPTAGSVAGMTQTIPGGTCGGTADDDVWYSFVATNTTQVVTLDADFDAVLEVRSGACNGTNLACADDNFAAGVEEIIATGLTVGNTYYVRIWSWSAVDPTTPAFDICVSDPPPPPANDACANAQVLTVNDPVDCPANAVSGDNSFADDEGTPFTCFVGGPYNDVWYSFNSGAFTSVSYSVTNFTLASIVVEVFEANCAGTSVFCGIGVAGLAGNIPTTPGTNYVMRIGSEAGDGGTFDLCLNATPPPPANDDCANAIAVGCNSFTNGTTVAGNGTDNPGGVCGGATANTSPGVWYTVTGWGGGMTASLCGTTTTDSQIAVYTGSCGAFTCVAGNDDACGLQSEVSWTSTLGTTYYIYVFSFGATTEYTFGLQVSCGDNQATCAQNGLTLEFQTDDFPVETTWEIRNAAGNVVATSGGPLNAPNGIETQFGCVPNGCYTLRVLDDFGDGMVSDGFVGGYILRTSGTNQRIIDNRNNFDGVFDGDVSALSGGQGFCLPLSTDRLIFTSCDKLDWVTGQYVVAQPNAAVSAEWIPNGANTVQDNNSGYEFWIFDPNGSYSFRRFRSHNVSDGFGPASATRACHMKLNNWAAASQVPANTLMNVRVRARINGVNGEFGPACRLEVNPTLAACPRTNLMDIPGNQFLSCGATRSWGTGNFVHARSVTGANRYQFRFRIAAEGFEVVRTVNTYFLQLNWITLPLQDGKTYDVDVRVSKDGGATWCHSSDPWGTVCQLTIDNTPAGNGNQNFGAEPVTASEAKLFPNPNRGDLLTFSLSAIEEAVNTVTMDIFDLSGKRISARTIAVADGNVNTTIDLNGELAAGMYLVNITAGEKTYTERLVIQP